MERLHFRIDQSTIVPYERAIVDVCNQGHREDLLRARHAAYNPSKEQMKRSGHPASAEVAEDVHTKSFHRVTRTRLELMHKERPKIGMKGNQ